MTVPVYIPNLKTSDSELRALKHLAPEIRSMIVPAFELTRSRITSKNPRGSIIKRAEQVREIYGDSSFILDLTTENDLINPEMERFFDEANGYAAWRNFLATSFGPQIIPCVQFVEGGSQVEFKKQVAALTERYGQIAIRTSVADLEAEELYVWATEATDQNRITVIGSLYFLDQDAQSNAIYLDRCRRFVADVIGNRIPETIAFPGSSFPKSVAIGIYGNDDEGKFPAVELTLFDRIKREFPNLPLVYADFASVHPIRYLTGGGTWVPRIDVAIDGSFSYSRLRNPDGGYAGAAKIIIEKYGNDLPKCWGSDQIKQAATGNVPGKSPSFWISARINMWITQRANELSRA
jgi:hypothetical protein